MKINYKESQIDFLAHVSGNPAPSAGPSYMAAQISLSLENLVILIIVAIMFVIFSFSIGIERGKRIALAMPAAVLVDAAESSASTVSVTAPVKNEKEKPAGVQDVAAVMPVVVKTMAVKDPLPGVFTLQVASYKAQKFAQIEADKLKKKGFRDVHILAKGVYTIVCVGSFQKKEDASDVKRQLKSRYQDFVVRRL